MTKAELMHKVRAAIDRRGAAIIELGETIRRHPELGFKEFKTPRATRAGASWWSGGRQAGDAAARPPRTTWTWG
jgi:hypothetical protein